ncbi:FAD/FMN-containing isoamyl alcohol oxidase-like protein MreA [Aaosphaeria arxii CBS 175.79]|uniref:FAD/FMN-containing isoamyl alcohol oxidase-like protein MreA n=1 Tax=Aaosphaeria arxii CBS 175.79 TaxID=1450172 RepID=A0A6A5XU95_9PLEO|nr:FAD/FMN-containing isoamyl alcohol oxidase-like protein MreA [Aaosphaeria arxii CBS 175.79]KAF2016220.1 FAD/FMN-containing isoamyl alcohol oxidase-like protein MreA [Aaosphaeria arxii CBS 175.79]
MFQLSSVFFVLLLASQHVTAINFPYERTTLKDSDIGNNSDIAFGDPKKPVSKARCRVYPGDADWPSNAKWDRFNATLGGALIRGIPPSAACYQGPYYNPTKCNEARRGLSSSLYTGDDPVVPNAPWQLGNPCPIPPVGLNETTPIYNCNITAYPAYVVNVTTVKHIQQAVNFARNNNLRITIKNTGHDWLGRSTGGGALQIWTRHLTDFEYLPSVTVGRYRGRAARVGVALEQYMHYPHMVANNITMLTPGSSTVGAYGGFMQGGGFGYVTSKYGLMADQVLSFEVVTADGRFVHAGHDENKDLFWAIRGGGPGNFGIVTSALVKAYDPAPVSEVLFNLQTNPVVGNSSNTFQVPDKELFWRAVKIYFAQLPRMADVGGNGWNNLTPGRSGGSNQTQTLQLTGRYTLPGFKLADARAFFAPVFRELREAGVKITPVEPTFYETYAKYIFRPQGPGESAGGGRFGSRLIPRENLEDIDSKVFNDTIGSFRTLVEEGGYPFHSVDFTPTEEVAGWPGADNAVNPALRNAIMHVTSYDTGSYGPEASPAQQIASHARHTSYIQKIRDVTPGSGAYMNEVDTEEPNFQQSLYGDNWERLSDIKVNRDPWSIFYAVTMVGSQNWKVEGTQGLPTQQGRLCRVAA